jgi:hypothetical protein
MFPWFFHLNLPTRQGAARKSFDRRAKIAAKHLVTTPLAELAEARRGQAPEKRH